MFVKILLFYGCIAMYMAGKEERLILDRYLQVWTGDSRPLALILLLSWPLFWLNEIVQREFRVQFPVTSATAEGVIE